MPIVIPKPNKICANDEKFNLIKSKNGLSFLLKILAAPIKDTKTDTIVWGMENLLSNIRLFITYWIPRPFKAPTKKIELYNSELLCLLSSKSKKGK